MYVYMAQYIAHKTCVLVTWYAAPTCSCEKCLRIGHKSQKDGFSLSKRQSNKADIGGGEGGGAVEGGAALQTNT